MTLDEAFDAWLDRHRENGFAASAFLNPPASSAALDLAEKRLGFSLPDDLRRLWQRANGQRDIFRIEDPAPGRILCPLFGQYSFLSVEEALDAYQMWLDIWDGGGPKFDDDFNGENDVKRRGNDPVHREYWRPGWLPFADENGNAYAVDLAPAPGGILGQVIVIGSDEDTRRVLAPSISTLLVNAASHCRVFVNSQRDDHEPILFFDLEAALERHPDGSMPAAAALPKLDDRNVDPVQNGKDDDRHSVALDAADPIRVQPPTSRHNLWRPRVIVILAVGFLALLVGLILLRSGLANT